MMMPPVRTLRILRTVALFVVGLFGVVYELVVDHTERPTLLILLGAMMNLPAFLSIDERRRAKKLAEDRPRPDGEPL